MALSDLQAAHDTSKAAFGKMSEAQARLDAARRELTDLTKLGDLVTPEDVITGAGKLVAHGLSPMGLAKLLSDMPDSGPALSGWLAKHAADLTQREAQLAPILASARHQAAVNALRLMVGAQQSSSAGQASGPPSAPVSDNSLSPAGAPEMEPSGG